MQTITVQPPEPGVTYPVRLLDWRRRWETMKSDVVDVAWETLMRDNTRRLYLYYTPAVNVGAEAEKRWGTFIVVHDDETLLPYDARPVRAEPVPLGTKQEIRRWLEQVAGMLPMIGGDNA